ncbi:MAG: calcium/sodium antiporter [Cyclobacteriaceae bacterium]|nr:calcium/sodium antiporter [Cyclobacteriaceae bacterium]UYN88398.1 MAG: calcium/sodium antiporter [Cyclobacteriaceae bacterium]
MMNLVLLLAGFVILIKGADFLVAGASSIAKKYGISNLAIGLTVVAFGTSMPELIVSLLAAINGQNDASFGNVIGSNNFNLLFILGLAGTIYPLVVQKSTVKFEIPISLLAAGVLFFLVNDELTRNETSNSLGRIDSVVLLLFFVAFMGYVYKTMKNSTGEDTETNAKTYGMLAATGMVILGLGMLIGGGKLVVDSAIDIAHYFGLSEKLVGLTILAAGTSLPELATSAVAAFKRNTDIAIGNVIGSNIFNVFFILGTTGLISPIPFNTALNFDIYVLLGSTIVLMIFMFTLNRSKLDRWEAVILLLAYITYTTYLISVD